MILDSLFQRVVEKAPWPVMGRARLARTFHPERLDAWFEHTAAAQYPRAFLLSTWFELMSQVVCGGRRAGPDAYQAAAHIATSVAAGDRKLARIASTPVMEWGRYAAQERRPVIAALESPRPAPLPGSVVKRLDGQARAAPAHRLNELRLQRAAAGPGNAVGGYEPARPLRVDRLPGEAGQAQERSRLPALVEPVQRGEGGVGDRNCWGTDFRVGIAERGASGIIREPQPVRVTPQEARRDRGRVETGTVAEHRGVLTRAGPATLAGRRIAVRGDQPTRDGDPTLEILPPVPPEAAPATGVARGYHGRWRRATAFQLRATAWTSEIEPWAAPTAARWGFAGAGGTDNVLAPTQAALTNGDGADPSERAFADYSLAAELEAVAAGMALAVPAQDWLGFRPRPLTAFVAFLRTRAQNTRWARFKQPPRGPKKPPPTRCYDPKHPQVSTARLIAART